MIGPTGRVLLPTEEWKTWLTRLARCRLKPEQKVKTLKEVVCSRMNYVLRISDSGIYELRRWTQFVRNWVKDILHLPTWCSGDWMHLSAGLGMRASEKMAVTEDGVVRVVGARLAQQNTLIGFLKN